MMAIERAVLTVVGGQTRLAFLIRRDFWSNTTKMWSDAPENRIENPSAMKRWLILHFADFRGESQLSNDVM
jgi:hypothetical protein